MITHWLVKLYIHIHYTNFNPGFTCIFTYNLVLQCILLYIFTLPIPDIIAAMIHAYQKKSEPQ